MIGIITRCTTVCGGHESVSRCDVTRQRKTRWMVKTGQDSCSVHSLTLETSSYAEPNHSSGPTYGFVASPEMGPGPLSVLCSRDTHSYSSKAGLA